MELLGMVVEMGFLIFPAVGGGGGRVTVLPLVAFSALRLH